MMIKDTGIPGFSYMSYRPGKHPEPVGFTLTNRGSHRINPRGLHTRAMREYQFLFSDRAEENIFLNVTDDVAVSGLRLRMHDDEVGVEDAGVDHGVTLDAEYEIAVVAAQERRDVDEVLDVVLREDGFARRHTPDERQRPRP